MSYVYIASPYTHSIPAVMRQRYEHVSRYAAFLKRNGMVCFSPIAYGHPMALEHDLPREFAFWRKQSLALLAPASSMHVLMLREWEKSRGVRVEIDFCENMGKRIVYMEPHEDAWEAMSAPLKVVNNEQS